MPKINPNYIVINRGVRSSSGLNHAEFKRLIQQIYLRGKKWDESYDNKYQDTITERESGRVCNVHYAWSTNPNDDEILQIIHIKKIRG